MQVELIAWWSDYCKEVGVPEFLLWHTPNSAVYGGSKENRERMGAMLKRMGQRSGVPDVAVMVPRLQLMGKGLHGLFLELKAPNGVISPEQLAVLHALEHNGYATAVCRTVEDAKQVITSYLQ